MWCGTIGAWLLVAGPLYQGALELSDVVDDFPVDDESEATPGVSAWWWLLPPAAVGMMWIRERRLRRLWESEWSGVERVAFLQFADRAVGWLVVSAGAFLLALEVTWYLAVQSGLSTLTFWLLIVLLTAASVVATAVAISRHQQGAAAAGSQGR